MDVLSTQTADFASSTPIHAWTRRDDRAVASSDSFVLGRSGVQLLVRYLSRALAVLVVLALFACDTTSEPEGETIARPDWVETVFPEPGSVLTTTDAVEVDHTLTATDNDVRLIIDGVDVTTYSAFDAGKLRYESGVGPVVLSSGDHWAEVQLVTLPAEGEQFEVLDSYRWEFRIG